MSVGLLVLLVFLLLGLGWQAAGAPERWGELVWRARFLVVSPLLVFAGGPLALLAVGRLLGAHVPAVLLQPTLMRLLVVGSTVPAVGAVAVGASLARQLHGTVDGYFGRDSAVRLIGRESVLMLGGGRALLMQVAHPLVAAGVHAHSDYVRNPWRRLARTMTALYSIVHGTREEADRVATQVREVHRHVRGAHGGRRYTAFDSDLMMWVHATLVDTGLVMYETFVGRLEPSVREEFYEDMKLVARIFGVPARVVPPTLGDFIAYKRDLLCGDVLEIGEEARAVASVVLSPPVPAALRPGFAALGRVTGALLPQELRERYGLRPGISGRLALAASARAVRVLLLPVLPARLRWLEPRDGEPVAAVPPLRLVARLAR